MINMNDSIELKKDEWLMPRVSTYNVYDFQAIQRAPVTKRWYQFWIPKEMFIYTTIEKKKRLEVS
jgi:hypothetical protein